MFGNIKMIPKQKVFLFLKTKLTISSNKTLLYHCVSYISVTIPV